MKKLLIALTIISSGAALADSFSNLTDKAAKKIQALQEQQRKAVEQHEADLQKLDEKIAAEKKKMMERQGTMRQGPNVKYYVHGKEPRS